MTEAGLPRDLAPGGRQLVFGVTEVVGEHPDLNGVVVLVDHLGQGLALLVLDAL